MKQREKLLAILAVAALLLSQGMPIYSHFFVDPIDERKADVSRLETEVQDRKETEHIIRKARTNLTKWRTTSLPPDWRNAQILYMEWLDDLAKMVGFTDLKVTPTLSLRPGKVFTPVRVSLEAKVGYDQLCRFFERFQKADLLHRISEMNIKKLEEGGGSKLSVTLVAESLALTTAEKRGYLLPKTPLKEAMTGDATTVTIANPERFPKKGEFLARSGTEILLVKSVDGPKWTVERGVLSTKAEAHAADATLELWQVVPKAKPNAPPDVAVDSLIARSMFQKPSVAAPPQDPFESEYAKSTFLRTLWAAGDQWEGWLYNASNEKTILHKGSTFQIADLTATVVELDKDRIFVETGDEKSKEKRELRLGANIQSMGKGAEEKRRSARSGRGGGSGEAGNGSEGGGRRRGGGSGGGGKSGGGRRGGRGFPGMNDPAMQEKMRLFREARDRGENPDPREFFKRGDSDSSGDDSKSESSETKSTETKSSEKASSQPEASTAESSPQSETDSKK